MEEGYKAREERQRRAYNQHLRDLRDARDRFSIAEYERHLVAFDEKWCPEVVERRKAQGLYEKWARERT